MKALKITISTVLIAAVLLMTGCSSMNKTGKGALIGGGSGAALGAGIGAVFGGGKGAAWGSAIGAAVGSGAGAIIGNKMDKQAEELAKIENAKVETVTDVNGLSAIKVTFDGGILFNFNSHELSPGSKTALQHFATSLKQNPDTDVTVYGHTDNVGSLSANEKVSLERAQAVENYLETQGVPRGRFIAVQGMAYNQPVASNETADGRAQNRRVEIFITANKKMIDEAEKGY